jgi:hypothetical protein
MSENTIEIDGMMRTLIRNLQYLERHGELSGVADIINAHALRVSGGLNDPYPGPDRLVLAAAAELDRAGDPYALAAAGALIAGAISRIRRAGT